MFTGIIKETGTVSSINDMGQDIEFTVQSEVLSRTAGVGDSISVNGVCLTVKRIGNGSLSFDVSSGSLVRSGLGDLKDGDFVNLEDSLSPDSRLGGHFVSGHVDAVAAITGIERRGRSYEITLGLDKSIAPFITAMGSVSIDGISLTITEVTDNTFKTVIIPHTYENTTLGSKGISDTVNIEVDMLARYVVNYLSLYKKEDSTAEKDRILKEKLKKNGFIQ